MLKKTVWPWAAALCLAGGLAALGFYLSKQMGTTQTSQKS